MNLSLLKQGFFSYLLNNDKLNLDLKNSDFEKTNVYDVSLFLYEKEFKDYLIQNYGADISIFDKSISEIMEMDIVNGELTEEDEKLFEQFGVYDDSFVQEDLSYMEEHNMSSDYSEESSVLDGLFEENDVLSQNFKFKEELFAQKGIVYESIEQVNDFFSDKRISAIFSTREDGSLSDEDKVNALSLINMMDNDESKLTSEDMTLFKEYVNSFYSENQKTYDEEINQQIVSSIKGLDGDGSNMTSLDFQELSKKMMTEQVQELSLDKILNKQQKVDESAIIEANKIDRQNTHSSNYKGCSTTLKSYSSVEGIKDIEAQITSKNAEIIMQNNLKAQAMSDDETYQGYISELNDSTSKITKYESDLTNYNTQLHDVSYDLIAAQEQLENLKDPVIFTEYQQDIDSLRSDLKNQIATLTQQKISLEEHIFKTEEALLEEKKNNAELKETVRQYEIENPNDLIAEYNKNISKLESDISSLTSQKTQKQSELNSQRKQELSDAEVFGKSQAYRQSEFTKFMMDYATNPETKKYYDEWYFKNWNGHSYCAIFTTNVTELMYAKVMDKLGLTKEDLKNLDGYGQLNNGQQGINGIQMGMHAIQWGNEIQPALDSLGINMNATLDITKLSAEERKEAVRNGLIYPGMTFEYKDADGGYHTGFVESINKDLTWTTIEGNITVKYDDNSSERHTVGAKTADTSKSNLASMTDSTAKAFIWAYQKGILSIEQINSMTYSGIFSN